MLGTFSSYLLVCTLFEECLFLHVLVWTVTLVAKRMVFFVLEVGIFLVTLASYAWVFREACNLTRIIQRLDVRPVNAELLRYSVHAEITPSAARRCIKEPPTFQGDTREYKERVFSMELAFLLLGLDNSRMVDYAAVFLADNERLWLIACFEEGV